MESSAFLAGFVACKVEKECPGTASFTTQKIDEDEIKLIMALKPVIDQRWNPPLCFLVSGGRHNSNVVVPVLCRAFTVNRPVTSPKPFKLNHATVNSAPIELPVTKTPLPTFKRKLKLKVPVVKLPLKGE